MNPWKILGVNRAMTLEQIRDAYIELARKYHPDASSRDEDRFSIITGAYALLKNKDELHNFLAQLRAIGKSCATCNGKGAVFRSRGITGRTATTCKTCEGSGIILKEKQHAKRIL